MPITPEPFIESSKSLRTDIKACAANVKLLHRHTGLAPGVSKSEVDLDEAHANIQLAYRHLEDAAMRLGKAIQAYDGGVSVYDK